MPTKRKPTVPATVRSLGNDRFLVLDFQRNHAGDVGAYRYQVYLLPPGALFEGFGGSRSGLLVGKTPSMILRTRGGGTWRDVEYDLADKAAWQQVIAEGLTNFAVLHSNGAPLGEG